MRLTQFIATHFLQDPDTHTVIEQLSRLYKIQWDAKNSRPLIDSYPLLFSMKVSSTANPKLTHALCDFILLKPFVSNEEHNEPILSTFTSLTRLLMTQEPSEEGYRCAKALLSAMIKFTFATRDINTATGKLHVERAFSKPFSYLFIHLFGLAEYLMDFPQQAILKNPLFTELLLHPEFPAHHFEFLDALVSAVKLVPNEKKCEALSHALFRLDSTHTLTAATFSTDLFNLVAGSDFAKAAAIKNEIDTIHSEDLAVLSDTAPLLAKYPEAKITHRFQFGKDLTSFGISDTSEMTALQFIGILVHPSTTCWVHLEIPQDNTPPISIQIQSSEGSIQDILHKIDHAFRSPQPLVKAVALPPPPSIATIRKPRQALKTTATAVPITLSQKEKSIKDFEKEIKGIKSRHFINRLISIAAEHDYMVTLSTTTGGRHPLALINETGKELAMPTGDSIAIGTMKSILTEWAEWLGVKLR